MNTKEKIHTERIEFVCEKGLLQAFKAVVKEKSGSERNVAKTLRGLMAKYIAESYE